MPDNELVRVEHLTHRFRLTRKIGIRAVDDVSFAIHRGEIMGLVGESGSGKSTVARCVMGILRPTLGRALYDGIDVLGPIINERIDPRIRASEGMEAMLDEP